MTLDLGKIMITIIIIWPARQIGLSWGPKSASYKVKVIKPQKSTIKEHFLFEQTNHVPLWEEAMRHHAGYYHTIPHQKFQESCGRCVICVKWIIIWQTTPKLVITKFVFCQFLEGITKLCNKHTYKQRKNCLIYK